MLGSRHILRLHYQIYNRTIMEMCFMLEPKRYWVQCWLSHLEIRPLLLSCLHRVVLQMVRYSS